MLVVTQCQLEGFRLLGSHTAFSSFLILTFDVDNDDDDDHEDYDDDDERIDPSHAALFYNNVHHSGANHDDDFGDDDDDRQRMMMMTNSFNLETRQHTLATISSISQLCAMITQLDIFASFNCPN